MRGGALALAIVLVTAAASPAQALPGTPPSGYLATPKAARAAHRHFDRGEVLFVNRQYAEALVEFEAGYAAVPLPGFLINIGQCRRHLGDMTGARAAYDAFLAHAPDSPLAPEVKALVRELVLTPPSLVVGPPPSRAAPSLAAPAVRASTAAPRAPARVNLELARVAADPDAEPAPAAPSRPPASNGRRSWWIWGAVTLAIVVTSAVVLGSGGGGTNSTIHDGTIGTLRRP
jgi:hypothetical protein